MKKEYAKEIEEELLNSRIIEKKIGDLSLEYDKIRGANVNIARISSGLIDGLKLVQRRVLFTMFDEGDGSYSKVATVSADTMGHRHPHGNSSISSAIVSMSRSWENSIPLIDIDGNNGTIHGDPAAAERYIKAKLTDYAKACFFEDWEDSVVDMIKAYDEKHKEPIYLPAKYPNVLLNGCIGIGYGMSSNIPCYNFKEIIDACILLMADPDANIVLIPDSPSGCDIIENDFSKLSNRGVGAYSMRCKYVIDPEDNIITITNLPYMVPINAIIFRIAEIKSQGGLKELISMEDLSNETCNLVLMIRDDVNPYKFVKKLIKQVAGLEKTYPVNITVNYDYSTYDYSIKRVLLEWITWRRDQKRTVINTKRMRLYAEQRENDVKIFLMQGDNLDKTVNIFRTSRNKVEIEKRLIENYKDTEIRMDSIQAKALSSMRMIELSKDAYEECLKRRDKLEEEMNKVKKILNTPNGIDKEIIAELRDGVKRFGTPRKSNVVPYNIKTESNISGTCILQLSSDGMILRRKASNVDEEPIPTDVNGFAVKIENDSSFIIVDSDGYHSYIVVNDIPIDVEVPVNRYTKRSIGNTIVALLPADIDIDHYCTLVSAKGVLKRFKISDMGPSKKPCISIEEGDHLVRGIVTNMNAQKDLLIYTKDGMGQRLSTNNIRATSPLSKGTNGFKLSGDDEIVGCYAIDPNEVEYLLYVTTKGKMRLNLIEYLPMRDSKHDSMLRLISLNDRDKLVSVIGCNKYDKINVYFDDGSSEIINIEDLEVSTMSECPKKVTSKNAVTTNVLKVKIL